MRRKVRNRKNDFKTFMDLNFSLVLVFNYFERDFYSLHIIKVVNKSSKNPEQIQEKREESENG